MNEPKPRLDRDARREAIIDVARDVFLEEGYGAASMSAIAARVGGSKGTLYNYFKSKEDLLLAFVERHCLWQKQAMFELLNSDGDVGDVSETLHEFGRRYLSAVLCDASLATFRLIVAEAQRSPQIGQAFYESGPHRGLNYLAGYLAKASEQGRLRIPDPHLAAHQFIGLCQNRLMKARLCNAIPEPTKEEIEREVTAAAGTFLAAFGADSDRH